MSLEKCVRELLKKLYLLFFRKVKFSIILNYHRIGETNSKNPFHRLHTINLSVFKAQVRFCKLIGTFTTLDNITNGRLNSKLNFSITFDDVSFSAINTFKWLEENKIPFAICPCKSITLNGLGWRDKVYFIIKYVPYNEIHKKFSSVFDKKLLCDNYDFYAFSKKDEYHSYNMIEKVVNPLFKTIPEEKLKELSEKNYISKSDLLGLKQQFPNLTIVNHSDSHANLNSLSKHQIKREVEECQAFLSTELSVQSKYFAVPFGKYSSILGYDLSEISRENNLKAILWVSNTLNLDGGAKPNKIKHLNRFHTPGTLIGLVRNILKAFLLPDFYSSVIQKKITTNNNFSVVENPSISKILAFEDLSRPTKDYSSNPEFFKNFYQDNPFLEGRPHTFAEIQDQRVMSLGHNLHLPFSVFGENRLVNFWGNWRGISGRSKVASSILLGRALKSSDIIASYKPSKYIEPTFQKLGWKRVELKSFELINPKLDHNRFCKGFSTDDNFDHNMNFSVFNDVNEFDVHINLNYPFLNWRIENYLLAKHIYFYLDDYGYEKAFIVAQFSKNVLFILDLKYSSESALVKALQNIFLWTKKKRIPSVQIETSCESLSKLLAKNYEVAKTVRNSCYFHSSDKSINLEDARILITPIASDTFLRP